MGIIYKNHLLINKTAQTSKILKMLRFAVFTFLALAVVTEAAPGGGYYWKKRYYKKTAAPAPAAPVAKAAPVGDLVDVAVAAGSFKTLVKLVGDLGLVDTLKGVEAATVFAPSDDAFAKLPKGTLESLTPEQAKAIVARHVVAGANVMAADVATGDVETFGGETVGLVKTEEGGVQVVYNGQTVNVVTADVGASNGVIHVIDNVIVGAPEPAAEPAVEPAPVEEPVAKVAEVGDVVDVAVGNGAFTTLVKIVSDLGLVETLKGVEAVTIFAPSDEAFAKLPAGTLESLTTEQAKAIVSRHVVAGATVMAADVATGDVETFGGETVGLVKTVEGGVQVTYNGQTVNVVTADVKASNGVIHVIDNVILGAPEPAPEPAVGDVVDVAVGAGAFTTLVKIVSDLGLVDTLKGVEAVTIFAPSDDAFAKLPAGTL